MPIDRQDLKRTVHAIMNDVVEQCFQHLIHHPQHANQINRIIREASDEINYQTIKIDAHNYNGRTKDMDAHYAGISRDVHKKSLDMLSRLQKIKRTSKITDGDEPPEDFSSPFQSF